MKKFIFILLFLATTPAFAVLSPLYQSLREFKTLLDSPEIAANFSQGEQIEDIRRSKNSYIITTGEKQMVVDVVYTPSKKIGPAEFKLIFQAPQSLDGSPHASY